MAVEEDKEKSVITPLLNNVTNKRIIKREKRPKAVAVKIAGTASYADALRKLKQTMKSEELGIQISGIRRTRAGEMFLEVKKGADKLEELKNSVGQILGEDATVGTMEGKVFLEIRDLDEEATETEVEEAMKTRLEKALEE